MGEYKDRILDYGFDDFIGDLEHFRRMMLEDRESDREESFSRYFKRYSDSQTQSNQLLTRKVFKALGFNLESCIKYHDFRRYLVPSESFLPISSLKPITLPELPLGESDVGGVLFGHLVVPPLLIAAVCHTVLQDADGRGIRVRIYFNKYLNQASSENVERKYSLGMSVAIKDPVVKLCDDSITGVCIAVCVDNPADICRYDVDSECPLPAGSSKASLIEHLEKIRSEGNRQFSRKNWVAADEKYSQCIREACVKAQEDNATDLHRLLLLSYSNRAEVRLRLKCFEDALGDADKALQFDALHVKSLRRKGRALHVLGEYDKAVDSFKTALQLSPDEASILEALNATKLSYEQSLTGNYDLSKYFGSGRKATAPPCSDFVGPVEVRSAQHHGRGNRGLFCTRDVESGELLCVSNPLAIGRYTLMPGKETRDKTYLMFRSQVDLMVEIVHRVKKSKRLLSQLYSLTSGANHDKETPSMELFRPGSEYLPTNADSLELDVKVVGKIVT